MDNPVEAVTMDFNDLTDDEQRVILHKGTERAFTGKYDGHKEKGTYTCRQCNEPLFSSSAKFDSKSGWPSFDDTIPGAVREVPDADGSRTEIVCAKCGGHLGHVFRGEGMTEKSTRHCVNSISLDFAGVTLEETAIFAGGCFWGVEYYLKEAPGVLSTTVGYTGGHVDNPTYKQVCYENTGHIEAIEVVYDSSKVSYEELARLFFEIHDPTQVNRQGPDRGEQYKSVVFYVDEEQRKTTEKLIGLLEDKGLDVATELISASTFWPAEPNHQDYYAKTGKEPYCHTRVARF